MKITTKRVTQGFTITLWTKNYLRTLWVVLPHCTKFSRHGSKAHQRFQERAAKESAEWWRRSAPGAEDRP